MTLSIRTITVDCVDWSGQVRFWSQATNLVEDPDNPNNPGDPEGLLRSPEGALALLFIPVPEAKSVKNRVHLDLQPTDSSRDAEVDRLRAAVTVAEAEISVSIGAEEALRAERAGSLPDELAQRYELLRSRLGGVGAARLVGDRCDGCHLTMSSVEVERIRHLPPEEFATCDQCDRILVH